ncbi:MAG: hypothetical protein COT25_03130 [Candidatus Kerfeldbacteria bacterium CG08_land_8_20_14_0_20_42_7]|uniref:O-antigen ligase-related domain-containing protein n=1 Tax=Candidatus Kerfeldbacteria bacterium CG08_land_8_20_14_0_20_42_7 TaxID=2014245 RepID=A0A2H0YSG6_9BACT|nr:MAG: hypothetical protein COT25_03130 [Candidatus Kerfeldbacteria bacterium CG08_land_8_20_14_0_20_42_7]
MKIQTLFIWVTRLWLFLLPLQTHYVLQSETLEAHLWPFGEISLYLLDILLVVVIFVALLARKSWRAVPLSSIVGFVIFVALLAVSVFVNHDAKNTWVLFLRFLEGFFLLAILAVIPDKTRFLGIFFIAGIFGASFFGVWQFIAQYVPGSSYVGVAEQIPSVAGVSVLLSSIGRYMRAYGTFSHPNIFGGYLASASLFLFALVLRRKENFITHGHNIKAFVRQHGWVVASVILFAALAFSFSRSAWLGLACGLVVLAAVTIQRNYRHELRLWVFAALIPIIFLTTNVSVFSPLITERVLVRESVEQVSLQDRHRSIVDGVDIIKSHWAEGIGLGRSTYYIQAQGEGKLYWWEIQPPHNIFLLLAGEASIFTAIAFLWVLLFLSRDAYIAIKSQRRSRFPLSALGLSFVVLIVVIGLFDHYLVTLPAGIFLLFTLLGFSVRTSIEENT